MGKRNRKKREDINLIFLLRYIQEDINFRVRV